MAPPSPNTTRGHLWEIAPVPILQLLIGYIQKIIVKCSQLYCSIYVTVRLNSATSCGQWYDVKLPQTQVIFW